MRLRELLSEKWSEKYKRSINCSNPKGFSQKAHCAGRKKKESVNEAETKKLGRAFNHLEDLVFFYGVDGTIEALEHLKEIASDEGSKSVRMKWDGNPQIYWGRETKNGPLILSGHNGWSRGAKTDNPEDLKDFIANKSGTPKTPEEKAQRDAFAERFANLYPAFDAATPKDFVGYVYADALFLQRPELNEGIYTFCPNPKSKTCYHVRATSDLGKRIASADVMVVGHAFFPEFGMDDSAQEPMDDFSKFNRNPKLIVQGPIYNTKPVTINTEEIDSVEQYARQHEKQIEGFLSDTAGLKDLKNIIYTYVNQTAKARQLANLGPQSFQNWLQTSKVSAGKQQKIQEKITAHPNAIESIFSMVRQIQAMKNDILRQIEGEQGDIWDTEGEGRVRYAGANKRFGNIKLVNRDQWIPGE